MHKYLVSNGHRVTVKSLPDAELEEKIRLKEIAELKAVRDKLTEAEVRELVKETMTLKERQVLQYSLYLFYTLVLTVLSFIIGRTLLVLFAFV
jgi:Zn-dependent M16 (insulinase) family peptidase